MAMIAMVTRSSISVKDLCFREIPERREKCGNHKGKMMCFIIKLLYGKRFRRMLRISQSAEVAEIVKF